MWFLNRNPSEAGDDTQLALARQWLKSGGVLLDVRTPEEFAAGHARGARNIPVHELSARLHELPAGTAVVVYCRSGARSAVAQAMLAQAGFDAVNAGGLDRAMLLSAADEPSRPSAATLQYAS
jgi:phage shock protein E